MIPNLHPDIPLQAARVKRVFLTKFREDFLLQHFHIFCRIYFLFLLPDVRLQSKTKSSNRAEDHDLGYEKFQ